MLYREYRWYVRVLEYVPWYGHTSTYSSTMVPVVLRTNSGTRLTCTYVRPCYMIAWYMCSISQWCGNMVVLEYVPEYHMLARIVVEIRAADIAVELEPQL